MFSCTTSPRRLMRLLAAIALAALLTACGGGDSAKIGGTVTGLAAGASVTLQDNNGDNLTITGDQGFTFGSSVTSGSTYSVSVLTQPVGETCVVGNGSGTVDSLADNVTIVTVVCSVTSSVGGTVAGLAAGQSVWLTENGEQLPIAANGAFAFPGVLPAGASYDVTVSVQPSQENCTVSNGSGVVPAGAMASVAVTCS